VEETLRAGWATDPVHPNAHIYAKMALNLLEKLSAGSDSSRQPGVARKRKRSESSSSSVTANVSNPAQVSVQGALAGVSACGEEPPEARPAAEAAAMAGMPDPRTAATATTTTTEAGDSRTAAEATEAAATGGRAADQAATTGPAGRLTPACLEALPTKLPFFLFVLPQLI